MQCVYRFLIQRHMAGLSIFGIAGSDSIGDTQALLPPADLFGLFQSQTHIVYVTGDADAINIDNDGSSMQSMVRVRRVPRGDGSYWVLAERIEPSRS
jgi:hypothetical protein